MLIIIYLDADNLYGWAMNQYLSYGGFKWLNQKEIDKFDVNSIKCNSIHECILEVALEYSDKLHKIHNDYALPPEKLKINHDMPSDYCSDIANKYDIKIGNVNKLVANVGNKSKYALHYKNLPLYLSLGITLTKAHRITTILD